MIGFDNYSINHQLLLALPFEEMIGVITHDNAKPHHILTLTGTPPTWNSLVTGFPYIAFDGAADYLQCPAANSDDLRFSTGDFTLLAWLYNTGPVGIDTIMCQNTVDACGWEFDIDNTGKIALRTNQAGAHTEISAAAAFTSSAWQLVGVTRHTTSGQFYVNGEQALTTGTLTDAVQCGAGANIFFVGVQNLAASNFWGGYMALPRIWERELSDDEMKEIFDVERHWYNI
jgi:hypothetical protein